MEERNLEGGTERDNGPLDAFLKGERISTDELIMLTLQQQFARSAREQNELEDFDGDGCIGDCSGETTAAKLRQQRESYNIESREDRELLTGFNRAALEANMPIWASIAPHPAKWMKPVWTGI